MRSIGADHVIDYTKEDFAKSGKTYDAIIITNGFRPITDYMRVLNPNGICVVSGGAASQFFQVALFGLLITMAAGNKKKIKGVNLKANQNDLIFVKELIEKRKVTPVIDRHYSFDNIPEAIRYLEEGHASGKVVITMEHN